MSDAPELPPRPLPPRRMGSTAAAWLEFVGLGRLVASAVSIAVVVAGGVWLLRAAAPTTEASLPVATGSSPVATLPPPVPPATTVAAPVAVVVHVAGAVLDPGVYALAAGARVAGAVAAAGGPATDADLDALNLAAVAVDGQRVYVPRLGEIDPADVPSGAPAPDEGGPATVPTGPVDLNTASVDQLETLPGVGPATAAAIVDDRTRNGPFASVDDLDRVPGIGPAKLAALRDQVTV